MEEFIQDFRVEWLLLQTEDFKKYFAESEELRTSGKSGESSRVKRMYTDLFILPGALERGTTQEFYHHTMSEAKLAEWLLRQSQGDSHVVKGNILGQVNSIAYQARVGPSRITTTNGKTGKTFRVPSNLLNASIESFAKGAPGATMLPSVQDRTIDNGLELALRPLVHPLRPLTKELVKNVYWNFVVAWLDFQSPLFRRYLANGKKTSGEKGYIALVRVVFASLDLLVGSPLSSDAVEKWTARPQDFDVFASPKSYDVELTLVYESPRLDVV